jgi:anaerobic sulfite reductase subunit A
MQQVTLREEQALSEDDKEGALYCLKMEKKFMEEHLFRWIPTFCEKIISRAELSFYREMAALTNNFIQFENEELNKYIESELNCE